MAMVAADQFAGSHRFGVDCTKGGFSFLTSSFPQLPVYMMFALVQLLFRGRDCREFSRISIGGIIRRWWLRINLQARTACTLIAQTEGLCF